METIVISVGGSLIVPDGIDVEFLKNLKTTLYREITENHRRFFIIAGGGRTSRHYQQAAGSISELDAEDIDWIGIQATRLNGHLLRTVLKEYAYHEMITNPDDILDVSPTAELVIAAGYRPGASTDLRAVQIAERTNATKVVNLSNTKYVFSSDPKVDPTAIQLEDISWGAFRKLIPDTWDPGLSTPFDPIAAKEAERLGIEVAAISGSDLMQLEHYLEGEAFVGTLIHP